jgi:hypothetical protein
VLVALLQPAQLLVERGILKGQAIWDQVRRGLVFGWHFLPAAPAPIPLPESIVDLHDLHTVPRDVLERLIAEGKRVCRFTPPYRDHLAQHFAVTYMPLVCQRRMKRTPDTGQTMASRAGEVSCRQAGEAKRWQAERAKYADAKPAKPVI